MNLAAAMVAMSLLGIQQDVLSTSGKAEEYVIRLTSADLETLREGRRLDSAIARVNRGGKLYRIYMDEQPNRQAVEKLDPPPVDVQPKASNITSESVFSITLSERELRDLEEGAVFGGALPPTPKSVGVKFEVSAVAGGGVAPDDERFPQTDLATRPNEVRNPRYRDDLPRSSPIARDQGPAGYDDTNLDPPYADSIRQRASTLGDSLPPMRPTSFFDEIQRRAATRSIAASSPARPDFSSLPSKSLYPDDPGFQDSIADPPRNRSQGTKIRPNTGTSITKDSVETPNGLDKQFITRQGGFDQSPAQPTAPTTSDPKLAMAVLLGLLSLGANFFLGWQVFGWYMRYRDVIDQVRMSSSWSNESRTSTI